ncbi:MAG TPA: hypothetical protein VLR88_10950 [Propionibacteriaceae bacterium]|nr:hypothetical protein [Propionibacteriaceae bacterium]
MSRGVATDLEQRESDMTITTTTLTRAAGLCAVVAGLLFIAVQINHPALDVGLVTTTEWKIRESMKIGVSVLALVGITGMYLPQAKKVGVIGLAGYLILSAAFLIMFSNQIIAVVVLPTLAASAPAYVSDILTVVGGGKAVGDLGLMTTLNALGGFTYIAGGLVFGIALFRAGVLARWASALLAVATVLAMAIPLLPQVNERLFAVPTGVALIGLGYSLWRTHRSPAASPASEPVTAPLTPAFVQ